MAAVKAVGMGAPVALKTVVVLGSARSIVAPWGGSERLGDRVLAYVLSELQKERRCGDRDVKYDVHVIDPKDVFGESGALAESTAAITAPHFFYKSGTAPEKMTELQGLLKEADCFVIVSPEYNHTVPPALGGVLSNFGGSNFKNKPAAIVTYSNGPWGGMRCAMALRPMLAELGMLSVSKLTGLPNAGDMFNDDGVPKDPENRMLKQFPAQLGQLEWLSLAVRDMKEKCAPP